MESVVIGVDQNARNGARFLSSPSADHLPSLSFSLLLSTQFNMSDAADVSMGQQDTPRIIHCQEWINRWLRGPHSDRLQQYRNLDDLMSRMNRADVVNLSESLANDDIIETESL